MAQRVQKLLSARGVGSRRACEKLIEAGRVTVNGVVVALGAQAEDNDELALDGVPIAAAQPLTYLMLHKPTGYITTGLDQRGRKTVMDLVADCPVRVFPVGRLDMDSEGLLVMTNDGDLANELMHPRFGHEKRYLVWVTGDVEAALPKLSGKLTLQGEDMEAKSVERLGDNLLAFTLNQGKNRQIRRMCAYAGLKVVRLKRISVGLLMLGDLPSGTWRALTEEEVQLLRQK